MTWQPKRVRELRGWMCVIALLLGATASFAGDDPMVTVIRAPAWSQGDEAREGAAEFVVLMEIARLKQASARAGLVAVGDRRGLFGAHEEEALQLAVRAGLPVVKIASGGQVLPHPHGLFLDGGALSPDEARAVLTRCLQQHGCLPKADEARRELLRIFQHELTLAASSRLAAR